MVWVLSDPETLGVTKWDGLSPLLVLQGSLKPVGYLYQDALLFLSNELSNRPTIISSSEKPVMMVTKHAVVQRWWRGNGVLQNHG